MLIRHFSTPGLFINSYLIFDEGTKRGAVIDPTRQIESYCAYAKQEGIEITDILETHVHADFVSGSPELKAVLGGKAIIHCSGLGGAEWTPSYADHVVKDRDAFHVGSLRFEARHTPGHTPEHLIWLVYNEDRSTNIPEIAFTGDLLFVGSVGRPDLLGRNHQETLSKQLYESLYREIDDLPDFLEIYPAHSGGSLCGKAIGTKLTSTLGYEKQCNPSLIPQSYQTWHDSLQLDTLPIPNYFKRMKQVNVKGWNRPLRKEMPPLVSMEACKSALVVDLRKPEDFAAGSIEGSINIPYNPSLSLWAGAILPDDKDFVLVVDKQEKVLPAIQMLAVVGLDRISGEIDASQWSAAEKAKLVVSPMISVEELKARMKEVCLVDVRTRQEWDAGHIEGALHIELTRFPKALVEVPADKPVAVICHSGNRASIVASLLRKERGMQASNVKGGMQRLVKESLKNKG
jgi:hydroxyacylglutathione hydrolase